MSTRLHTNNKKMSDALPTHLPTYLPGCLPTYLLTHLRPTEDEGTLNLAGKAP